MAQPPIPELLDRLLRAEGPSGHESAAVSVWTSAASFADEVTVDPIGSPYARSGNRGSVLALFGHIDEIGLIVTHIDEKGFLWFGELGGWDPQNLSGQRVNLQGRNGLVPGVIGRKPAHFLHESPDFKKVPPVSELCIDIGVTTEAEAAALVRVGDVAVLDAPPVQLAGERVVSRALDNRVGAYVVLETLRRCDLDGGLAGSCVAVASVQEESSLDGARAAAHALRPDIAIAVDALFESDAPGMRKEQVGDHRFGSGPMIVRGAHLSSHIADLLVETAEELRIGYTICAVASGFVATGGTDADAIQSVASGVPCGLVGIPARYHHSAVEMVDLRDVEATVRLLTAVALRTTTDRSVSGAAAANSWRTHAG